MKQRVQKTPTHLRYKSDVFLNLFTLAMTSDPDSKL